MTGGRQGRLRWLLSMAALVAGAVLVYVAVVSTAHPNPVAQRTCSDANCSSPSSSATGPGGSPSNGNGSPVPRPSASSSATPKPSQGSKPSPAAPPPPPRPSTGPPAAGGYFSLRPVGSWSSLPSDSQCAGAIHYSTWEPRPQNNQQNHTEPAPGAMAASFASRPRDQPGSGTYNSLWDTWLLRRVDGRFTGTTDEILQWAACKWGLPDNVFRADAAEESTWFEYLHFPNDASYGGGGGGSCYWNRGCGDDLGQDEHGVGEPRPWQRRSGPDPGRQ